MTPLLKQLPKVLGRSALGTINLIVAGSSALGAAALHSWPILALGGAAYAALVAWDVASPKFWRETLSGKAEGELKLPDPNKLQDPGCGTRCAPSGTRTRNCSGRWRELRRECATT